VNLLFFWRQRGKTTRIVEWVKEGAQGSEFPFWDRVMLVFGDAERDRVIAKYELNPRQVFTWDNWKNTAGIAMSVEVAIDAPASRGHVDVLGSRQLPFHRR